MASSRTDAVTERVEGGQNRNRCRNVNSQTTK